MRLTAVIALALAGCGAGVPATTTRELKISTPAFTLAPGEEVTKCYYTSLPSESEVAVTRLRSSMTPGSHHMILFYLPQQAVPDGTLTDCGNIRRDGATAANIPFPLYLSQEAEDHLDLPAGVAMPLRARQPIMFQMHYLNASRAPIAARVDLTIEHTDGDTERAGPFASFHTKIAVPPRGTQTVSGHCRVPPGSQFFSLSTHSHRFSTSAAVHRWRDGQMGAQLVDTRDWEHPTVTRWSAPFLVLADDEEVYYSCTYQNDGDAPVKTGDSAATDEMCMAIGYYFPAPKGTICIDSRSFTF